MAFPESKVAHKWLDPIESAGGKGVEFGAAAHNPFGLQNCIYADITAQAEGTTYYAEQIENAGHVAATHVIAELGKPLPFETGELDYIVTSHVLEHVWDLLTCFAEMRRVLKPYGLMVHVVPHLERTFDKGRPLTTWEELRLRQANPQLNPKVDYHHSVFNTRSFLNIVANIPYLDILEVLHSDDKVGNGFLVVLQISHTPAEREQQGGQGPFPGEAYLDLPRVNDARAKAFATSTTWQEKPRPSRPRSAAQTARSAACPCGSGQRFKHCHGRP